MESKNRNVWIVVVMLLLVACCCFLAATGAAVAWFANQVDGWDQFDLGGLGRERVERTFQVGDAPALEINNFAGSITVRAGESNTVQVVATKKAPSASRLERIEIDMSDQGGRLVIQTKKLFSTGNASVDLEIRAPAGTRLEVDSGAGAVDVRDISGAIKVHSGAGSLHVRGASDRVRLSLGAGEIQYEGRPVGDCSFETGAGTIRLRLPADSNVKVDLGTGLGSVSVGFAVDGRVSPREVRGVIGDGSEGSISAHTGVGAIMLSRR